MYRKKWMFLVPNNKIKAYGLFFLSILIMGFGISLVTQAHLGTTPITSTPYVLSLSLPVSFGILTMLLNLLFVLIEVIVMGKDFPKVQYLQILVGPILGVSIDFWSYFILLIPQPSYFIQLSMVIIGCVVIAYSTVLQLKAKVVNNPAEGMVKAISIKTSKSFGTVKVYFDVGLVFLAAMISIVAFGSFHGIREGTIISALIIGPLIRMFQTQIKKQEASITEKMNRSV